MGKDTFKNKSFEFAIKVVNVCKLLVAGKKEFVLSKQLLRSGTAIGALHREAEHAESKKDFMHKMSIAQKEANETRYWLELLYATGYINQEDFNGLINDLTELLKLSTAIIKSTKNSLTTNS